MASTAGDESSRPPSSSSPPPPTTAESSQSAPPSPSAAVYTLCTEQPLDGGDGAESHHLRILVSILGSEEVAKESLVCVHKTVVTRFSAKLTPEQLLELSKEPGVVLHVADGRKHHGLDSKVNCSASFKKCYELSEEPDNMVVQDLAREHLARLVLDSDNKLDQTAEDAVSKALSLYDSLGELGKQDAADAYFQLGCHQNDCYWNIIDPKGRSSEDPEIETGSWQDKADKAKQLAEEYWQKAIEFYTADTYPDKYLEVVVAWSTLSYNPSRSFHTNEMLASALDRLMDGRKVSAHATDSRIISEFLEQAVLWKTIDILWDRRSSHDYSSRIEVAGDELKKMWRMSMFSTNLKRLPEMYELWARATRVYDL